MIAGTGDGNLVEIRIAENPRRGGKTTTGMAPDADAIQIHIGITRGQLPDGSDLVRQSIVAHVAVIGIVERLGPSRRSHRVHLDHNKTKLCQCLFVVAG